MLPTAAALLGVGLGGGRTGLSLPTDDGPPPRAVVVLLVDGLGLEALHHHRTWAPYLSAAAALPLQVGFPTTTTTSLATLGTGLPSGRHGLVGLECAVPGSSAAGGPPALLSGLAWEPSVDPLAWQPEATVLELAAADGVAVTRVGPRAFDGTGLTEAALRGGRYAGAETPGERLAAAVDAAGRTDSRALVYCYHGELDATGHRQGWRSAAYAHHLGVVDRMVEQLARCLPGDALLLVTADHGMVDVPDERKLDYAAMPELREGVLALGGEGRARYAYCAPQDAPAVAARWSRALAGRMTVLLRDEAVRAGWFGPTVRDDVLDRVGDVVAVAEQDWCLVDSSRMAPHLLGMRGWHGSLTSAERLVPLVAVRGEAR